MNSIFQKTTIAFVLLTSLANHQANAFNWQEYTKWAGYGLAGVIGLGWFWHQSKLKYQLHRQKRANAIQVDTTNQKVQSFYETELDLIKRLLRESDLIELKSDFTKSVPRTSIVVNPKFRKMLESHGIGYVIKDGRIGNTNNTVQSIELSNKFRNAFELIARNGNIKLPLYLTDTEEETVTTCLNNLDYEASDLTDNKKACIWKKQTKPADLKS